ncbi:MAG: cupin domain-containing protein [Bacteriovoracaceae bacterium]|nr:cupin domain-containing protein [Bacteriovoracaceae bacterium]
MEIKNYSDLQKSDNPHGVQATKIHDSKNGVVMHLLLKSGESLKPHKTPVDVSFYVLEGTPTIMVGDEKVQVKKDDIIESPKDIVHCIYNESSNDIRVLVMKLPRPTAKTSMV